MASIVSSLEIEMFRGLALSICAMGVALLLFISLRVEKSDTNHSNKKHNEEYGTDNNNFTD
jgi:hypothetical protein